MWRSRPETVEGGDRRALFINNQLRPEMDGACPVELNARNATDAAADDGEQDEKRQG